MGQYIYIKNSNKKDPGLGISKNVLKIVGERCVAQTINALATERREQGSRGRRDDKEQHFKVQI
jgi:hypothetical protein